MELFVGKAPTIASLFKLITPFLTDKNIQKAIPDLRSFIQGQQETAGGKFVISGELSDDNQEYNLRIWLRDRETKELQVYKELDLFQVTQQQIKDFVDTLPK